MIEKVSAAFFVVWYIFCICQGIWFGNSDVSVEGKCNKTKTNNFEYVRLHVVYLICFNSQKWIKKNFNSTNELKMS